MVIGSRVVRFNVVIRTRVPCSRDKQDIPLGGYGIIKRLGISVPAPAIVSRNDIDTGIFETPHVREATDSIGHGTVSASIQKLA